MKGEEKKIGLNLKLLEWMEILVFFFYIFKKVFLLLFNYSSPNFPLLLSPALPPSSFSQSSPYCPITWVLYTCSSFKKILKYILLIMLLHLSHFLVLFIPLCPVPALPPSLPHLSSCPWVVHISPLASSFPILFLTSPSLLPTIYASYSLYLFPILFSPLPCW